MAKSTANGEPVVERSIPAGEAVEDAPKLNKDMREMSNQRMGDLLSKLVGTEKKEENFNKEKDQNKVGGETPSEGAAPKVETSTEPQTPSGDTNQTEPKKPEPPAKKEDSPKPTKVNYEEEYKKHQSRADKLYQEKQALEEQVGKLKEYEQVINAFQQDPVRFINEYVPDVAQQLKMHGDPVSFIESKAKEFRKELDSKFKEAYGDDWKFSESEALEPGTPSFRYKIALDDMIGNTREQYRNQVTQERTRIENRQKELQSDRERLKADFGFTDEDLQQVDEFTKNNKLSYYLIGQVALMDKIIQQKLSAIDPPPPPPPDITDAGGKSEGSGDEMKKLSKEAKSIVSRFGAKAWQG